MNNHHPIQKKFHLFYLIGLTLILTLPLWAMPPLFHPPAWGKSIMFRSIFSLMLLVFAYQLFFKGTASRINEIFSNILNKKSRIFWPFWLFMALLAVYFLATLLSLEFNFSMWGSPYRSGGFVNYAFYIIFAIFTFLILKRDEWQKVWDINILVGILISLLAFFQKFSLFKEYILAYTYRPVSTMGGSMFLATYLVLLTLISFSFFLVTKSKKRYFYLGAIIIFLFIIILTATRSALLGVFGGGLFFTLFLPNLSSNKKILKLKLLTLIILILGVLGVFALKANPQIIEKLKENEITEPFISRIWTAVGELSIKGIFSSRGDGWKVILKGVKDRPILGYGPENISIPFDKYYQADLKGIQRVRAGSGSSSWWDKSHNFLIDHLINAGILGLGTYLLFFASLLWQLQKSKKPSRKELASRQIETKDKIIIHGIQATFIGYFITNFFSFDLFSTYLISFLIIGYSFFFINNQNKNIYQIKNHIEPKIKPYKYILIFILTIIVIFFIYNYNFKLLYINKEMNKAAILENQYQQCQKAIDIMEEIIDKHTIINNNIRLQYVDIITECLRNYPQHKVKLSRRAVKLLDEARELRPYYTRTWQFSGVYTTKIFEDNPNISPEEVNQLSEQAYYYLNKALELSPGRQKIFHDLARLDLALNKFEEAEKKVNTCIEMNPDFSDCWYLKTIIQINKGQIEKAEKTLEEAAQRGYPIKKISAIGELINVYSKLAKRTGNLKYYQHLIELYPQLIELDPENFQHYASFAFIYKVLGQYDKAREQALIVFKLNSELKSNVEEFLKTLPYPYNKIQ